MSDLCAPVYVVMEGDEELTFWCFVEIMNRMVGMTTLVARTRADRVLAFLFTEAELPPGSERHAKTVVYTTTIDIGHGSRVVPSLW